MSSSILCSFLMQCFHTVFIATLIFKGTLCCQETNTSFAAREHCNDVYNTTSTKFVVLWSNTTIGQKIDICDITDSITFDSFRVLMDGVITGFDSSQRIAVTDDFLYSFYLYDYNQWIAAQCDDNIYDISCSSSISPLLSFDEIPSQISGYTLYNIPYITVKFPFPGLQVTSYTSLIWIFSVIKGFSPSDTFGNFVVCDISDVNTDNVPYEVFPETYNAVHNTHTSWMYTLSSECSTDDDNSLTSLNLFDSCGYPQSSEETFAGRRLNQIGESYSQYFAVPSETILDGISLFFDVPPGSDNAVDCNFVFELNVYYPNGDIVRSTENTITSVFNDAQGFDFVFDEPLIVSTFTNYNYYYFQVTITDGLSDALSGPGSGCDIGLLLCYDKSNMKTWFGAGDTETCIDYSDMSDMGGNRQYQNMDIAFDVITSDYTSTQAATSDVIIDTTILTTLLYYTSLVDDMYPQTTDNIVSAVHVAIDFKESFALYITISILAGSGVMLLLASFIVSRYTKSDNFIYSAVAIFVVHSIDVFSDIFFCISIWTDHALIVESTGTNQMVFVMLAIASLAFIVLPMFKNFYDLIQFQRETQDDPLHGDRYRAWLNSYGTTLLIFALISGSTFGTMKLMNSNLLCLRMFSMGLCISHLREYHSHRMVNVVLMENLPQLIIQMIFVSALDVAVPAISIIAVITSVLSIIVAIVDHFSKKELTKQCVPSELFTFQITSNAISAKPSQYKNRQRKVIKGVSKILVLDKAVIEIVTIDEYSDQMGDGLIVHFLITTLKCTSDEIHQKLKDSILNETMQRNMSKAWDLVPHDAPRISNLRWLQIQSEQTEGVNTAQTGNTNNIHIESPESEGYKAASNSKSPRKRIVVKARDTLVFNNKPLNTPDVTKVKVKQYDAADNDEDDDLNIVAISSNRKDVIDTNKFKFDGNDEENTDDGNIEIEMGTVAIK